MTFSVSPNITFPFPAPNRALCCITMTEEQWWIATNDPQQDHTQKSNDNTEKALNISYYC